MVENIYALKNKILKHVENETQNMERINVNEIGELVDMVKDLAEAEKSCWEAQYYRSVSQAMEDKSGYPGGNTGGGDNMGGIRQGYSQPMRQGYNQMMGHDDIINKLGNEYRNLSPEEKMVMKSKVLSTLGSM